MRGAEAEGGAGNWHLLTRPLGLFRQSHGRGSPATPRTGHSSLPRRGEQSGPWRQERFSHSSETRVSGPRADQESRGGGPAPLHSPQAGGARGSGCGGAQALPGVWEARYVSSQVGQADLLMEHEAPPPAKLPLLCRELRGMSASSVLGPDSQHTSSFTPHTRMIWH